MKPKLILLVGNIACGKSTVAELLRKEYEFFCISLDGMRRMLGSGMYVYDKRLEPIIQKTEKFMMRHAFDKQLDIVIDDACNVNSYFRNRTISLAKERNYTTAIVEMPHWDKETCIARRLANNFNATYDKELWETVYDKFKRMYDEIYPEEADHIVKLEKVDDVKKRIELLYNN
jgi:predicted kinase